MAEIMAGLQRDGDADHYGAMFHSRLPLASLGSMEEDAIHMSASTLSRRQAEWDRKLESFDQQQAEIAAVQWKLVREQVGTLSKELLVLQQQLNDLRIDSRRALIEVERYFRENESKITEERVLRQAMCDSHEQRLKKVRLDLEAEARLREAADAEVAPKIEILAEAVASRCRENNNFEAELRKLHDALSHAQEDISFLKEAAAHETAERCTGQDSLSEQLRDVRDRVVKETRDRSAALEDLGVNLARSLEQEKSDRNLLSTSMRTQLGSLQKDFSYCKDELPGVRGRLLEIEATVVTSMKDSQKILDRELAERSTVQAAQQRLERRIAETSAALEREASSRVSLAVEAEQGLKSLRASMKHLAEQVEAARTAREEMILSEVTDQLERESSAREAQQAALHEQLAGQRAFFVDRVEAMESGMREGELRHREHLAAEAREREAWQHMLAEDVARQFRESRDSLQARLLDERTSLETQHVALEEHVDYLDGFFQDMRELFVHNGNRARPPSLVRKVPLTPRGSSLGRPPTSSLTPRLPASPAPHLHSASGIGRFSAHSLLNHSQ